MRVLVTGAAGFIGSHLCDHLLDRHRVVGVDDLSSGSERNLEEARRGDFELHRLDVASDSFRQLVADVQPHVIFHLAAQMDVRKSIADPLDDGRVNVLGTLNVVEAARRVGCERVVFTSSGGTVYGETHLRPTEDAPLRPVSPYGAAKVAAEVYLATYSRLYGLATVVLRLANVYGPRQSPHGEAGVVAIFGGRLLADEPTVVYGDGSAVRDYVMVSDTVEAIARCADGSADGQTLNIGTGIGTSVRQLHAAICGVLGVSREPQHRPPRDGELTRNVLDPIRATRVLGWRAQTRLHDGLVPTLDWIKSTQATRQPALAP